MAFVALLLGSKACSDLTAPTGVNDVSVQFRTAAGQTRLDLIVGDSVRPDVVVMLGGTETSRARYVFTSSDPNVIRVYANGDSIVAEDRGTATLVVTLVGSTIGNNRVNPASRTADTILVAAAALTNVVSPTTITFQSLGARQTVVARSLGRNNKVITGTDIVWRSTAPGVVSVTAVDDSTAELTSVGNGMGATVYAVFGGVDSTTTTVNVSQQLKRYILSTAASPNLRSINETMAVTAQAVDSLNTPIAAGAPAPAPPTFQSDNPGKVEVNPSTGVMTAIGNTDSPVRITATVGGAVRSDTLPVTVTQVAASLNIQADTIRLLSIGDKSANINVLAPDALGTQVPSASIRWTPDDPAKVQVEGTVPATMTALATGTTVVRARADQQVDSVIVIVTNDPAAVAVAPKPLALRSLNEQQTLTATVTNTAGTPLPVSVTWTSRAPGIAELQATPGVVVARATGETYVVATTANGRADSTFVRVTNAPDTVNIVPADLTLASVGDSDGTFAVELKNALGAALPRTAANWSSQDVTIARALDGVITAVGPGTTYIVAVSPENANRRDSVRVTVTNAAASVVVTPDPAATMTALGATTTFTAVVRNQAGAVIQGAPVVWSVQSGGAVSLNAATGVAMASANGTSTVRATSGGAFDDVSVTVAQAISTSTSRITTGATSLPADGASSTPVTVRLRDAADSNISSGGAAVTLALSPAIATLSPVTDNGDGTYGATLTAGVTSGSVTVSGTVNGATISGTAVVALGPTAASQYVVAVRPNLQPVAGAAVTVSARLADANGNTVPTAGNVVTWSSTGGGAFSSATSTTDATGVASVTFTTSSTATTHTVTATTGSVTGTSQAITPTAGAATHYAVTPSSTAPAAGSGVVVSAQLRDANANAVRLAGQTVTWSKSDANGAFSAATSATDASGVATVTLTTHTTAGTSTTVTATTGTLTGTSAVITTAAAGATQLVVAQPPSATAQSGVPFPVQPTVQLRDAFGNNVGSANIAVTAAIASGGGTIGGTTTVLTDATGLATFANLSVSGLAGARTLSFMASGVGSTTAAITLEAGPASQMALLAGNGQSATVATAVAIPPAVRVRDAAGNPVAGVAVTFTLTTSGGPGGAIAPLTAVTTDANGDGALTSWTLGQTAGSGNNVVTASAAGLTGSPVTFTASGTPGAAQTVVAGSALTQNAVVGSNVSAPPSVVVQDQFGNAVGAGAAVTFTLTANGGGGGAISPASPAVVNTSSAGVATLTSWTVGLTAGAPNTVDATVGTSTVTFTATGTSASAQSIVANSVTTQSAVVGTAVAAPPSVLVRDAGNNPVASFPVTFSVTATGGAGGAIAPAGPATVLTDASGVATLTSWTVGQSAGTNNNTVTATGSGLATVVFNASGTPGAAASVVATSATSQSATVGTAVAAPPSVVVRDAFGNAVGAGTSVTFTLTATGGAGGAIVPASPATVATDASGVATLTSWTLGQTAGTANNTVTATIPTLNTVTFNASGTAGTATTIAAQSVTSQSAAVATAVPAPPSVLVTDASGNPVAGFAVTFTLTATGGSGGAIGPVSPATVATNASGVATLTSWTLGQSAGTSNNTVTATGAGLATITFNASGTAGAAQNMIAGSTMSQSAVAGSAAVAPSVVVRDAFNNPVAGTTVTFTLTASGGTGGSISPASPASVVTDASGVAGLASWTLGQSAGSANNVVTAAVAGLTGSPLTFTASGTAGAANTLVANSATSQTATVGTAVAAPPSVMVRDQFGNAVGAGVNVTFTLTVPGGAGAGIVPASAATVATDASGVASLTSWTLGQTAGTNNNAVTATIAGLNTVTFNASGAPAGATQVAIVTQPSATATAGVPFPQQPVVELRDAFGNLVTANSSTVVTAARAAGTGALQGTLSTTAVNGVATFTNLAHGAAGTITIQFTASGLTAATSANVVVAGPTQYLVTSSAATAAAGSTVLITAQLADAGGNPAALSGKTVNWSSTAGGSFTTPTSVTDANGQAQVAFRVSTTAGTAHTVTATDNTALTGTSAPITATAGAPQNLVANSVTTQSATVATNVSAPPSVIVRDQFNNPVGAGVNVTFTLTATGGTGGAIAPATPATVATDASGVATLTSWTLGQTAGTDNNTVTATIAGLNTVTFNASGTPGAADLATSTVATDAATVSLVASTPNSATITVQLRDAFGNITTTGLGSGVTATTNANGSVGAFSDAGGGRWTATFTPLLVGTATVTAAINGSSITHASNPVSITIVP